LIFMRWSMAMAVQQIRAKRQHRMYNFLIYSEAAFDSLSNNFRKRPDGILTVRLFRLLNK
jgi:rhamnopyranosyl-N-acetylglucosaminyl-diphospho-decaprenol beta-1,3/1,4-galactofuranosyltransferase